MPKKNDNIDDGLFGDCNAFCMKGFFDSSVTVNAAESIFVDDDEKNLMLLSQVILLHGMF
jgi:hypothetical protein